MELLILSKLKWDLTAITSYDYLDYMINSLDLQPVSMMAEVETKVRRNTEKLVTLCATDETFMSMPPSLVAASALVTALEQDKTISNKVNLNQIIGCIKHNTNLEMVSSTRLYHNELKCGKKVQFGRTIHCLPQRLKSMFFENILSRGFPKGTWSEEIFSKNIDFSL